MIRIYNFYSDLDFIKEFEGLDNTSWNNEREALGVLYDYLDEEEFNYSIVRDWLRFEVVEMTEQEIKKDYDNLFNDYPDVEEFLNDYTVLYGSYEHEGETYYLFSGEF